MDVIYESWTDTRKLLAPEELIGRIQNHGLQIVVIEADFIFDEVFESTNNLRFIGVCRATVNNVDIDAFTVCELLEKTAKIYYLALSLGKVNQLPPEAVSAGKALFNMLHKDISNR